MRLREMHRQMVVTDVRRIEKADGLPPGTYEGELSGYAVTFETPSGTYEGRTQHGIRGTIPITVVVYEWGAVEFYRTPEKP